MSEGVAQAAVTQTVSAHALLHAEQVDKNFYDGGRVVTVLRGLDLDAAPGEEIAIIGQSGVGKSTLLHVLGSLERPTAGKILFDGRDLFGMDERTLAEFRNQNLGFVFQFHYLLADFSALENVAMPGLIARMPDREANERAAAVLELVGLKDKLHRRPAELSGGEQQRVAVARAVVLRPRLVLADEPTGNLDPHTADEVHDLFHQLSRELGITLIVATHNERLSRSMTRVLRLLDGRLSDSALSDHV